MKKIRIEFDNQFFQVIRQFAESSSIDVTDTITGEIQAFHPKSLKGVERNLLDLIVVQDKFIVECVGDTREIRDFTQLFTGTVNVTRKEIERSFPEVFLLSLSYLVLSWRIPAWQIVWKSTWHEHSGINAIKSNRIIIFASQI